MKSRRTLPLLAAATAAILAIVVGWAVPAQAAPAGCPPDAGYSYSGKKHNYKDMVPYASGGPGVQLTITITAGITVTGTIGGQVQGDVNAIFVGAKVSVNASFSLSLTATVAYSGSWKVPSDVSQGRLHAGADRDSFNWNYGSYNGACKWIVHRKGTGNLPYHLPAFWHTTS